MGLAASADDAAVRSPSNPKVAVVSPSQPAVTLSGDTLGANAMDLTVRMISVGRPHRAVPLTGAMCVAVAACIEGTVVNRVTGHSHSGGIRIGHPSGVIDLAADVQNQGGWRAERVVVYRTARRLMEGSVLIPKRRGVTSRTG